MIINLSIGQEVSFVTGDVRDGSCIAHSSGVVVSFDSKTVVIYVSKVAESSAGARIFFVPFDDVFDTFARSLAKSGGRY